MSAAAPDRMPPREETRRYIAPGAASLDDALDQLAGAYTESRLEQIAYPDTMTTRGWRLALRYAMVVIAGERAVRQIAAIDEAYPLQSWQD